MSNAMSKACSNVRLSMGGWLIVILIAWGVSPFTATVKAQDVPAKEVLVFAATSLTDALGAVAAKYEKRNDHEIVLSFTSSSTLALQIENGAPAEIYASADIQWMDYLENRDLIRAKTRQNLVDNRLVLIAPKDSDVEPAKLSSGFPLAAWLGDGRLAMGDPDHVPAGIYGKQALTSLKVWNSVRRDVARAEDVRAALELVALGEAPLGIVYTTDALAEDDVKIIGTFPADTHPPIIYPVALTIESKGKPARMFLDYMLSDEASAVYRRYGFKTVQ